MPNAQEIELQEIARTPIGFAELILGMKLYPWQEDILNWYIRPTPRTLGAVCTPNGAGKSSGVVAALALWWASIYQEGKVVITTKDAKQLEEQLYPSLERHRGRFSGWKWVTSPYIQIDTSTGGKIVAFTTNDAGRAEGWHKRNDHTGPLLMIVDEAKSVEPSIFEAIDRCTYNGLLYVSSPGEMVGQFYDAFTRAKGLFRTKMVSLLECPHIPREKIEMMRIKYGEDSPLYRSSILGQFMHEGDVSYVFSKPATRRAMDDPPRAKPGAITLFCDFAGGGDENVVAKREGNGLSIVDKWREKDTSIASSRLIMAFRKAGLTERDSGRIFGDNGGMGKVMIQHLWKLGWEINPVDNQTPPFDKNYLHRGAEMWHETASAMRRGECVFEPDLVSDEDFFDQLTNRRSVWNDNGKLGVEKKKDMQARGVPSPDRADAVCGAWFCHSIVSQAAPDIFEQFAQAREEMEQGWRPAGMDVGA